MKKVSGLALFIVLDKSLNKTTVTHIFYIVFLGILLVSGKKLELTIALN